VAYAFFLQCLHLLALLASMHHSPARVIKDLFRNAGEGPLTSGIVKEFPAWPRAPIGRAKSGKTLGAAATAGRAERRATRNACTIGRGSGA
jgi:hypothetical protein